MQAGFAGLEYDRRKRVIRWKRFLADIEDAIHDSQALQTRATAVRRYIDFVRDGVGQPPVRNALQDQVFRGGRATRRQPIVPPGFRVLCCPAVDAIAGRTR